jgi:Loader and inhibitor of phage G40P.
MTREQTKKMILYLHMAYRDFCGDKDLTSVVNIWHDAFKDYDVKIVEIAAKNYVKTNEFAPTIAGIMKQIRQISKTETETDLWALIQKAASNGIYNSAEEFEKLPPECQSFIGSADALKELSQIDMATMETVVKGQFLKRVEAIQSHQEVQKGLPAEVRQAIEERRMLEWT